MAILGVAILGIIGCATHVEDETIGGCPPSGECIIEDDHLGILEFDTNEFIPRNTTSLEFENKAGDSFTLTRTSKTEDDHRVVMDRLCDCSFYDRTHSYYSTKILIEIYEDNEGRKFKYKRYIRQTGIYLPAYDLFDQLTAEVWFNHNKEGILSMPFSFRDQNPIPEGIPGACDNIVGDTYEIDGTVYEKMFMSHTNGSNVKIYASREEGLIGLSDEDGTFWKLKKDDEN